MYRWLLVLLVLTLPLLAQKYSGPRPEKPDLPYLVHADNLVATEPGEAKQEDRKNELYFVVPGAASTARTPLSSPIFLMISNDIVPQSLHLYKMDSKGGQREVLWSRKKKIVARPRRMNVTKVEDDLYRLEVDELLENGEYSLSPEDSNKVFCFAVY